MVKCKVVKNKVAPPFKLAEFAILYGKGISRSSEVLKLGVDLEVIEKSGAWYYYNGERLEQGADKARVKIESDPALMADIEAKIREKMKDMPAPEADEEDDQANPLDDDDLDIRALDDDDREIIPTEGSQTKMVDLGDDGE